jgi:O-antigen/teichoic acid export membrane protein
MSLKRQVASGLFWVALAQVASKGLSFVTTLILAKLLAPALFGLVGMAALAIAALQYFQDIGFDAALIYQRENVDEASHTAFVTVILSSLLVYLIAVLVAPWVAAFFREPAVVPVLRVLALTVPIFSLGRVPYVLLSRELDFRRKIFPELAANVAGSGASIALAFAGAGVWSLVWGQIVRSALAAALIWLVTPWRPRLHFNWQLARTLFGYGKQIVSSQTLIFLITNVDNAVVGRYAGQAALGFYQFAYNVSNNPATQITSILSQVMFPAFSKLADEDPRKGRESVAQVRARYYLTTVRYVTWITMPIAVATILFAPEFIHGLYGNTWAPAILPLQLLAIYGLIRSVAANMGSVFRALGKPQWLTYIAAWRLATMLIFLYPVTKRWGINGVSALSAIVAVVDFVISASLVGRLVAAPWRAYGRMLIPTAATALAAGLFAHWLYPYLPLHKASFRLLAAGAVLVLLYAGLAWLVDRELRAAIRNAVATLHRYANGRRFGLP